MAHVSNQSDVTNTDLLRILEESDDTGSSNSPESEVPDSDKNYTQYNDNGLEDEKENQPQQQTMFSWQPTADNYSTGKILFFCFV
jgi:hypothetical protein